MVHSTICFIILIFTEDWGRNKLIGLPDIVMLGQIHTLKRKCFFQNSGCTLQSFGLNIQRNTGYLCKEGSEFGNRVFRTELHSEGPLYRFISREIIGSPFHKLLLFVAETQDSCYKTLFNFPPNCFGSCRIFSGIVLLLTFEDNILCRLCGCKSKPRCPWSFVSCCHSHHLRKVLEDHPCRFARG